MIPPCLGHRFVFGKKCLQQKHRGQEHGIPITETNSNLLLNDDICNVLQTFLN